MEDEWNVSSRDWKGSSRIRALNETRQRSIRLLVRYRIIFLYEKHNRRSGMDEQIFMRVLTDKEWWTVLNLSSVLRSTVNSMIQWFSSCLILVRSRRFKRHAYFSFQSCMDRAIRRLFLLENMGHSLRSQYRNRGKFTWIPRAFASIERSADYLLRFPSSFFLCPPRRSSLLRELEDWRKRRAPI